MSLRDELHKAIDATVDAFEAKAAEPIAEAAPVAAGPSAEGAADADVAAVADAAPDASQDYGHQEPQGMAVPSDANALPVQEGQGQPEPGVAP